MLLLCAALLAAGACGVVAQSRGMSRAEVYAQVDLLAEFGRRLFFDPSLSASGRLSCASCHDPAHAYGPADERAVMPGGKDMRQSGLRAVPSLRYLQAAPAFTEHFRDSDDEGDASVDNGPTGGLTWDGRVDRGRDQARLPLLSPLEMANDSPAAVVAAVRRYPTTGWDRAYQWYCRLLVVLIGGTGGTTMTDCARQSHWSHPAVPPIRTKILCSTTGTTGPTEKLARQDALRESRFCRGSENPPNEFAGYVPSNSALLLVALMMPGR